MAQVISRSVAILMFVLPFAPSACRDSSPRAESALPPDAATVKTVGDAQLLLRSAEAKDALTVMQATDAPARNEAWRQLKATQEYQRLAEREKSFHRAMSDTAFYEWLTADSTTARAATLTQTLNAWMTSDIAGAVRRAAAYLPPDTPIRASLYFMIKPHPNTFVYGAPREPTIFVSVDPSVDAAQFENEIAHELHHIGYAAACPSLADTVSQTPMDTVVSWMSAFGEGWAMLAAAGGPDVNPHWESDSMDRARWDHDYANVGDGMRQLSGFFNSVLTRRISGPDSVQAHAMSFFGIQGPWYTVGYLMARTIEVQRGRAQLISVICSPPALVLSYQQAARDANRAGAHLPLWPERLVGQLGAYVTSRNSTRRSAARTAR